MIKKDKMVLLRMTSQDKKQLQKNAKQEGKSVSDFIRAKTLNS
jgi:uncharacterized protein (DUF1778 family)